MSFLVLFTAKRKECCPAQQGVAGEEEGGAGGEGLVPNIRDAGLHENRYLLVVR